MNKLDRGQPLAALEAPCFKYRYSPRGSHSSAKAQPALSAESLRLIRTFWHRSLQEAVDSDLEPAIFHRWLGA